MKPGLSLALAVGFGYLLGRRRKLRTALFLGAAVAVGRLSRDPGQLLARGTKALGVSPQLGKVADLGGPLMQAGKAAARAAVSNRIDAISQRLHDGSEALRRPMREAPEEKLGAPERGPESEPESEPAREKEYDQESEAYDEGRYEEYNEGRYEEEEEPEQRAEPVPAARRRPQEREGTGRGPRPRAPEEPEEETSPPRATRGTRAGGAPARRRER